MKTLLKVFTLLLILVLISPLLLRIVRLVLGKFDKIKNEQYTISQEVENEY